MKKFLPILLLGIIMISCGPSAEEMAKAQEQHHNEIMGNSRIKVIEEFDSKYYSYQIISIDSKEYLVTYKGGVVKLE